MIGISFFERRSPIALSFGGQGRGRGCGADAVNLSLLDGKSAYICANFRTGPIFAYRSPQYEWAPDVIIRVFYG